MKKSLFLKIYIIPSIFISPLITISSNSWFSIWIIIEYNLLSFIPLIIYLNKFYKELSIKYFLIQSIRSSIIILSTFNFLINNHKINLIILILNLTLIIKIGAPPFHSWFINLIKNINWINCLILSTWQKIIPIIILIYIINKLLLLIIICISTIISATLRLNHQSIRIIFRYSSINHIRWIILNIIIREILWIIYFITYIIINFSIIIILNFFNIFYINQIINLNFKYKKIFIFINILSIRGLPPILGFNIKWLSIYFMIWNKFNLLNLLILLISIFIFLLYIRLSISFLLISNLKNKLNLINKFLNLKNFNLFIILSINLNLWIIRIWIF